MNKYNAIIFTKPQWFNLEAKITGKLSVIVRLKVFLVQILGAKKQNSKGTVQPQAVLTHPKICSSILNLD